MGLGALRCHGALVRIIVAWGLVSKANVDRKSSAWLKRELGKKVNLVVIIYIKCP